MNDLSENADSNPPCESESERLCTGDSEEDLLDRIVQRKERFWDTENKQLESYHDPHPSAGPLH